ncbi:60S ribosomal protein L23a-like [Orcinus orca]|uniref:60S ribosomal protein L23a-like n=1 Tax=Orcinus orca TaxID=9733 RepID=UPI0014428613|nr:60S ribosomal protein L23a-like [Orcinus orca]
MSGGSSTSTSGWRNGLFPPRGCHVVVVSSVPSGDGGSVATDGRPTPGGGNCSAVSELWYLECPAGPSLPGDVIGSSAYLIPWLTSPPPPSFPSRHCSLQPGVSWKGRRWRALARSYQGSHKKRSERYPPSKHSKHCGSGGSPNIPRRAPTRRNKLDLHAIIKVPLTTESAMKKIEDNSTPVFIVEVKANEHQTEQDVKKLYDFDVAKVNTLIRPDGEKKAYVRLAPDYDALGVANKIGII